MALALLVFLFLKFTKQGWNSYNIGENILAARITGISRLPDVELPLNKHGGLLSYGHSGVAGGLAHLVEMLRRMEDDRRAGSARSPWSFLHADGGVFSSHVSLVLEGSR